MSDLIWLSEAQMRRIELYFPLSHGVPRVDDRRIISGIIFVIKTARDGAICLLIMVRLRRSTTALSGGAGSAFSTRHLSEKPKQPTRVQPASEKEFL